MSNKRSRTGSYVMNQAVPMQVVPVWNGNQSGARRSRPTPYVRRSSTRGYGRSSYRRRNKFNAFSHATNPSYPRPEVKWFDTTQGTITAPVEILNDGSNMTIINKIGGGIFANQRIGQQVATKSVFYQLVINLGPTAVPIVVRHMLFWDKQPTPAVPLVTDLLAGAPFVTSPLNLNNRERFVVLAEDRITLSPMGDQIKIIDGFRNINQLTTYVNSAVAADPTTGSLNVFLVSDEPAGVNSPRYYGTWRVRYIDN
nr:capsid protein [Blackfly multicomponent virus 2]